MGLPYYDAAEQYPIPRAEIEWRRAVVYRMRCVINLVTCLNILLAPGH
jgi:hypothetical protein